ncbi:hypothetical protein [Nocardia sp. alder85J]|uniref:hypothetical protein n=1 Tax=Nocardia sp. alder85J TaxID=2862949 RepID=UPI001CD33880|nr:hypothetical protein [Nocardia sp. alder85J]MCX4095557.1 hypothetical protein [Nocardia sp. alder85J]
MTGPYGTDTVDMVTIVQGEIYAVFETGETLLRAGDSIVDRGNRHTWSNRTEHPVTMVAVMLPARC